MCRLTTPSLSFDTTYKQAPRFSSGCPPSWLAWV